MRRTKEGKRAGGKYVCKKFKNILHIFCPVYTRNFYVIAGVPNSKFLKIAKKELGVDFNPSGSDGKFYVIKRSGQEVGVIWSEDKTIHLMHELLHATFWVMESAGIELTRASEEAFTYYQSYLYRLIKSEGL